MVKARSRSDLGPGGAPEARDGKGRVEVLPHLRDYPIGDGPGVDPVDGALLVAALGEDDGPDGGDGVRDEFEAVVGRSGGGGRAGRSGEEAHQKLVRRGTVEPPLQVRGDDPVDRSHVADAQGSVEGAYDAAIAGLYFLQSFLRVSQFGKNCSLLEREKGEGVKESASNGRGRGRGRG